MQRIAACLRHTLPAAVFSAVAVLSMLTVSGCTTDAAPREAVAAYVKALPDALAARSLSAMRSAATPDEVERVRMYGVRLVGEHRRIDAHLLELTYLSAVIEGRSAATVVTRERWSSRVIDTATSTATEESVQVTYHLVRDGSRWLVDSVEQKVAP